MVLEEFGDDDSAGGQDDAEEDEDQEESLDDTDVMPTVTKVQAPYVPCRSERNRQCNKNESAPKKAVKLSSSNNSSTVPDVQNNSELLCTTVAQILSRSCVPTEDVHEAFGRYIASELRHHVGSAQVLSTCKREIFMAISRMHDADDE